MEIQVSPKAPVEVQHAHMCANCRKNGKQVLWMHADEKGVVEAHTCPECGSSEKENWIKTHVPTMKLPGGEHGHSTAFEIADTFLLIALGALAVYWILAAIEQFRRATGKAGS